jgi:hypothetical protein
MSLKTLRAVRFRSGVFPRVHAVRWFEPFAAQEHATPQLTTGNTGNVEPTRSMGQGYATATRQSYHFPEISRDEVEELMKDDDDPATPSGGRSRKDPYAQLQNTTLDKARSFRMSVHAGSAAAPDMLGRSGSSRRESHAGGASVTAKDAKISDGEWMYNLDSLNKQHKEAKGGSVA